MDVRNASGVAMMVVRAALWVVMSLWLLAGCADAPRSLRVDPTEPFDVVTLPPISLPRDDAPHDNLTEWWYVTGHLQTAEGHPLGFEFVIFESMREGAPTGYAAHFAITDIGQSTFTYAERTATGPSGPPPADLNLCVSEWSIRRIPGGFSIVASLPEVALQLELLPTKPAVLHNETGVLDFSPFGWSYYYSYPRVDARGVWLNEGLARPVQGTAWIDHQWGDFISVGTGGWDWFSVQLADGRDFTASVVRDDADNIVMQYGTLVDEVGAPRHLTAREFSIQPTDAWRSPHTGATYPSGWRIEIPGEALRMNVQPFLKDQELDTRASTGVVYWEGAVEVTDQEQRIGHGYVELTGYAPVSQLPPPINTVAPGGSC